ncbi:hypothetical protein [Aestuariivirga sp.]|uniref:hypothetical protein n=1 Tax=Aestuariivirga sp. TaxID=2650926 RepID=UPI003BA9ABD7
MKRTTLYLLIALASTASALAAVSPKERTAFEPATAHETVIEKNQAYPLVGPLTVEECLNSDCSVTRS